MSGKTRREISELLTVNVDTITDIVKRFNKNGISSFITNKGGRKEGNPKWDTSIFTQLIEELKKQTTYYTIPKMVTWIKETTTHEIPEITVWYQLTHIHNFSYKSSRPHPYLGDIVKQEVF